MRVRNVFQVAMIAPVSAHGNRSILMELLGHHDGQGRSVPLTNLVVSSSESPIDALGQILVLGDEGLVRVYVDRVVEPSRILVEPTDRVEDWKQTYKNV